MILASKAHKVPVNAKTDHLIINNNNIFAKVHRSFNRRLDHVMIHASESVVINWVAI